MRSSIMTLHIPGWMNGLLLLIFTGWAVLLGLAIFTIVSPTLVMCGTLGSMSLLFVVGFWLSEITFISNNKTEVK